MNCPDCLFLAPNRVWRTYLGGSTLDRIEGKASPEDTHFPEDWLLSTTRAVNAGRENVIEGESTVITASGKRKLSELLEEFPEEILGKKHLQKYGKNPGFLLKYLDSSIRLHMQCHPTISFAQKHLNSNSGKSEGYYILGIRPGCEGYIYLGFQHPISPAEFKDAIVRQDSAKLLAPFEKIPVKPGDAFFVPGGFPHAIGEGVFMIEMMEPTDFAVRLEFERGGYVLPESARFMNRGVDFAISMFDFTAHSVEEIRKQLFVTPLTLDSQGDVKRFQLIGPRYTKCFRSERITVAGIGAVRHDSFRVLVVVRGSGELRIGGDSIPVRQYDRLLIPAAVEAVGFNGNFEMMAALPPEAE